MRIVIVSDLHVGSEAGLTPFANSKLQGAIYSRWADCIQHFGTRPDLIVCNGDAVDGLQLKGRGAGDSDWISKQIDGAAVLLSEWRPKRICIVSGTPYHTATGCGAVDFEELLAARLRAGGKVNVEFTRKANFELRGWFRVQFRHRINSSGIPHGRFTAQSRSKAWGALNAYADGKKAPHLSVFSHVHYWTFSEDAFGAAMTTPCWQALGSSFGDTCDGHVDLGAVQLTIGKTEAEGWSWQKRLYPAAAVDRTVRL